MGILVPTVLAGGAGMLVVAGAYGGKMVQPQQPWRPESCDPDARFDRQDVG